VERTRDGECEGRDRGVEVVPLFTAHLVAAVHAAHRGLQGGAAGVTELFARAQEWLFAHHALAGHLLYLAVGVGNHPVPIEQPGRHRAIVVDGDGVGEDIMSLLWHRLGLDITGGYVDVYFVHSKMGLVRRSLDGVKKGNDRRGEKQARQGLSIGWLQPLSIRNRDPKGDMSMRHLVSALLLFVSLAVAAEALPQALLAAVSAGQLQRLQDLIDQGADVNAKNAAGRPALLLAAFNGNLRTLRLLLAAGADVNAQDGQGNSALMEAAAFGHGDIVSLLILSGADVNLKNNAGVSALKRATLAGQTQIAKQLQDAGATDEAQEEK